MSKFANTFLKSLNEEKEGNAFTKALAKTKKGGKFKINGKEVTDTSNYDDHSVKTEKKKMGKNAPYAIGMAQAMKSTGDRPPLKKSTIKKGHSIAKKIMKEQVEGEDDSAAWKASLDKGTDPSDFETPDNPQINIDSSGVDAARSWVEKLGHGGFRVHGRKAERAVHLNDVTTPEAMSYISERLKKLGVPRLLSRAGAVAGDVVWIGDFSFDYAPDM